MVHIRSLYIRATVVMWVIMCACRMETQQQLEWLILDARAITDIDLSGLHVLGKMNITLEKKYDMKIVICNVSDKVRKQLSRAEEVTGHQIAVKVEQSLYDSSQPSRVKFDGVGHLTGHRGRSQLLSGKDISC